MKYTPRQYARAFLAVCKGKSEEEKKEIIKRFFRALKKDRDYQRRRIIFSEIEKQYLSNEHVKKVKIESASSFPKRIKKEIEDIFGKKIMYAESVKKELGAGIKILVDGELLIDATARRQVNNLFRKHFI